MTSGTDQVRSLNLETIKLLGDLDADIEIIHHRWLSRTVITLGVIFMDAKTALKSAQMAFTASVT